MPKKPTYEELEQRVKELEKEAAERKRAEEQAEEALAREHSLLRTVIDNLPDYIYVKDKESRYVVSSNAHVRFLGATTPDEVIGKTVFELFPQELASQYYADDQQVIRSGKPLLNKEEHSVDETGKRIWNLTTKVPLRDSSEKIVGLVGIARDVTKRVEAEEALRESEEKHRTILESIEEGYYEVDIAGNLTFFNDSMCKILGHPKDELMGMNNRQYMDRENAKKVYQVFNRVYNTGKPDKGFDWEFIRKDGTKRHVETSVSVMKDAEGKRVGFRGILRDTTERKLSEQALRESEERYRTLVQNIPIAVYRTIPGSKGRFLMANPTFLKMFGLESEKEPKKISVSDVYMNPKDRKPFSDNLLAKGSVTEIELPLRKKDGTPFWGSVTARVVHDESGKNPYFDCTIMDITARKQAEEEKEKLQAQLSQAQKVEAIGTLAGGIAHNFNNLLMGVMGNTSLLLLETDPSHPNYERLKNIEKSAQNGSKLTRQLLGYAREGRYEIRPTSLNQLVKETSATFAMTKKEIRVHQELAEDLFGINADQGQIEQALLNLYVNALDAMPGGGDLFLETMNVTHKDMRGKLYKAKYGNYVLLTVRDTGIGMDKKTQERIFDPFFTTKGIGRGTGLGLASVYGIIKAHGGYIDVESKKWHGTTFSIYLPASSEKEVIKEEQLPEKILKGKETILLVDDEDIIIDVGEEILKTLGYKVLSVRSGKEAIELYRENREKIDMVLLDMIMPDMGGGETYDRMKEINPDIKVLLSSGYSIDGQATEILRRGCDGFIQKPFNMKGLSQRLREILDKD